MRHAESNVLHISLLPGFVCHGNHGVIDLSDIQQRLVAALAVAGGTVQREGLACRLWPDLPAIRAMARLRQTLWRLNQATDGQLLRASHTTVALADDVQVDYLVTMRLISLLIGHGTSGLRDGELPHTWETLQHPLLLAWDLDWLYPFQETWQIQRTQALEKLAEIFLRRAQHTFALTLADAAAQADPLREGPRRIAIQSCLCVGEIADAHRRYRLYQETLRNELGISPSGAIPRMLLQAAGGAARHVPVDA
jgi:DNA-binding SARP family transcriptional activator